jgi:hypothetical protein
MMPPRDRVITWTTIGFLKPFGAVARRSISAQVLLKNIYMYLYDIKYPVSATALIFGTVNNLAFRIETSS